MKSPAFGRVLAVEFVQKGRTRGLFSRPMVDSVTTESRFRGPSGLIAGPHRMRPISRVFLILMVIRDVKSVIRIEVDSEELA